MTSFIRFKIFKFNIVQNNLSGTFCKPLFCFLTLLLISTSILAQNKSMNDNAKSAQQNLTASFPNCVFYEIFIRSFCDSNNDGIGDIPGIISKLDYLHDLGIEGIWLTPFNAAPSYHKYDVTDYYNVDEEYGTLDDVRELIAEAHKRNIKVIMDFVVNHTSVQHPWFIEAQKSKTNAYHNYYTWADENNLPGEKHWWHFLQNNSKHIIEGEKYLGFFDRSMPDLNYDNNNVRSEIIKAGKYWLKDIGMDGFRLDAAKWIYMPGNEKKNYSWWQQFVSEMKKVKPSAFFVGEITDKNIATAPYLKDALTSVFNFELAEKIVETVQTYTDSGIISLVNDSRHLFFENNPGFIDATFITNHDQDRIASFTNGDDNKTKMAAAILLTLPGSPFIYYGEELGMTGKKPDEQIREPFLWNEDAIDAGQTSWIKAKYSVEQNVKPLSMQIIDGNSIYAYYKKLISIRNQSLALRVGELVSSALSSDNFLVYQRAVKLNSAIVIHNLQSELKVVDLFSIAKGKYKILFATSSVDITGGSIIKVPPYSSVIIDVTDLK